MKIKLAIPVLKQLRKAYGALAQSDLERLVGTCRCSRSLKAVICALIDAGIVEKNKFARFTLVRDITAAQAMLLIKCDRACQQFRYF